MKNFTSARQELVEAGFRRSDRANREKWMCPGGNGVPVTFDTARRRLKRMKKCPCGSSLPTHLLSVIDGNEKFKHICSCERAYQVKSGKFELVGTEHNPVARFDLKAPNPEQSSKLFEAARAWKAQGARSKWSTKESLALWDLVEELEADAARPT